MGASFKKECSWGLSSPLRNSFFSHPSLSPNQSESWARLPVGTLPDLARGFGWVTEHKSVHGISVQTPCFWGDDLVGPFPKYRLSRTF